MAYKGKSNTSSNESFPTTNTVKLTNYISRSATNNSKSFNTKYTGIAISDSQKSPSKNAKPNRALNSGVPCTSKAFTPSGKPSALRTVKNPLKGKDFTSEVSVNNSNPSKNIGPSKMLNSGTPCNSKIVTPLRKSSDIQTVKNSLIDKKFTSEVSINNFNSPSHKDFSSNKGSNSGPSSISKTYTSLESLSSKKSTEKLKKFILRKPVSVSMYPNLKNTGSNKKLNSDTSCASKGMPTISSEKSSVVSTAKNSLKTNHFISQKTSNDTKSLPFKHTISNSAQKHLMGYHTPLEEKSTLKTQNRFSNSQDFSSKKSMNESISSLLKITKSNKEFNSGTPCTFEGIADISSEKSSAVSAITNIVEPSDVTPQKTCNDSKSPCISSEKSPVISTVINIVEPIDFIPQKSFNDSKSPFLSSEKSSAISAVKSNVKPSDFTPQKNFRNFKSPCISSEKLPNVNTVKHSVKPNDFIPQTTVNDFKPPCISSEKSPVVSTVKNIVESIDFIPQKNFNDSKSPFVSSEKSSAVSTLKSIVKPSDFIPQKTFKDSKSPCISSEKSPDVNTVKYSVKPNYFIPQAIVNDSKSSCSSSEKSCAVSTVENSVRSNDFISQNTSSDSKSPPFKNTASNSTQQRLMRYYTFLETKSAIRTGGNTVKPKDFIPENPVSDSRLPPFKDDMYDTVRQSTFNNLYSPLRKPSCSESNYGYATCSNFDFVKDDEKEKEYGSSRLHSRADRNRSSSNVDLLRCIICIDKERDTVFQPCGHLVVCRNCANNVDAICPMCRKRIKKKIKAFIT